MLRVYFIIHKGNIFRLNVSAYTYTLQ